MTLIRLFAACFMLAVTAHDAVAEDWVVDLIAQPAEYSLDWIPDEIEPDGAPPDEGEFLLVAAASDSVEWLVLEPGMTLPNGSWVRTGESGRLLLRRGEETIQFKPDTTAAITSWEHKGATLTDVEQRIGSVFLEVETRETKHTVVETPLLAAVVKGTGFTVNYDGERASVLVEHGVVEVVDRIRNESVDVRAEQRVEVSRSRPGSMTVQGLGPKGIVSRIAFSSVEAQQEAQPRHVKDETQIPVGTEDPVEQVEPAAPVSPTAPLSPAAPAVSGSGPILQQATALEDRRIARRAAMQEERRAARIGTRILERQTIRQAERQTDRIDERQAERREERRAERVEERRAERVTERRAERVEARRAERVAGRRADRMQERRAERVEERQAGRVAERRAERVEERRAKRIEERRAERVEERRAVRVEERQADRVEERQADRVAERRAERVAERRAVRIAGRQTQDVAEEQVDPLEEQQVDVAEDRRAARVEERQAERIAQRRAQRQAERAQDRKTGTADPSAQEVPEEVSVTTEDAGPDGEPDGTAEDGASGVAETATGGTSGPVQGDDVAPRQSETDDTDDRSPATVNLPTAGADETGSDGMTPPERRAQRVAERQAERQAERREQAAIERAAGRKDAGDAAADRSSSASISTEGVEPDEGPAPVPTPFDVDLESAIDIEPPQSEAVASGDLPAEQTVGDTPSTDGGDLHPSTPQTLGEVVGETMPIQVSEDVAVIPTSDATVETVDHEAPLVQTGEVGSTTDVTNPMEAAGSQPPSSDAQPIPVEPDGGSATPSPADRPAERPATAAELRAAERQAERVAARQAERAAARQAERDAEIAPEQQVSAEETIDAVSPVWDGEIASDPASSFAESLSDDIAPALTTNTPAVPSGGADGGDRPVGQHRGNDLSTLLSPDSGAGILEDLLDLAVGTGAFPNTSDGSNGTGDPDATLEAGPFASIGRPDRGNDLVPPSQAAALAPIPLPASALLLITALIGGLALGSVRRWRHR